MPLKILLSGASGRMGRAISEAAPKMDLELVAKLNRNDEAAGSIEACDLIVEFSHHSATAKLATEAIQHKKPMVIGTTGHDAEAKEQISKAAEHIPVVYSGNYSVGVNLLFHLSQKASEILGEDYQAEVLEMHHKHKIDAPSGTASRLIDVLQQTQNIPDELVHHGRKGITGERPNASLGVHALRAGSIVGEHTVFFVGDGERIELTHRAQDRSIFAQGALRAGLWVCTQPSGLYSMQNVLGF